ncbi:gamma-glutamyltransferase [Deferribacter thermophilus]|uniref:gamma-glutamyltransferase n=1 Tax=Deferribacter thermophilus TaxID=53573 RepID=UPI003C1B351F
MKRFFCAVSAGDYHTMQSAIYTLEKGGNAFDAAVSSFFTACLAELPLTSPAGGGYLTYFDAKTKDIKYYDFFVNVPSEDSKEKNFYPVNVDFKSAVQTFHVGYASTAVPGNLAGILTIHQEKGCLPLSDCLEYPIKLAEQGFYISPFISYVINDLLAPIFLATEESKKQFVINGTLLNDKTFFKNFEYANFLKTLIKKGADIFYNGELADQIEFIYSKNGGLLQKSDLMSYAVEHNTPLTISLDGYELHLLFKSSIGGMLLYFSFKFLEKYNHISKNFLLDLVEVIKETSLFRNYFFKEENLDLFINISKEHYLDFINRYLSDKKDLGNTTHFSIVDKDHNAVSCTTSNGEGCGVVIPNTGFMMNNMLGEEDLNFFGFFNWPKNKRLFSMMSPTIITKNGEFYLALGSAGSNRIRSAILNTIYNFIVKKLSLEKSINSPRIHFENNIVYYEQGFPKEFIKEIEEQYDTVKFDEFNMYFGGVHAAGKDFAASDTRRNGHHKVIKHSS